MPTLTWIKNEFAYGYSSGSITTWLPDRRRRHEERQIGGSYRRFFREAVCHKVSKNSFATLTDGSFDVFFSVGVLCHNNAQHIGQIMTNARPKMETGTVAVQHYADGRNLDALGWAPVHNIPAQFRDQPDDKTWWRRNDPDTMIRLCEEASWQVIELDFGSLARDSVIRLRNVG